MLIHLLTIIKNNLRSNVLLMAGMFVIATSLWYAVDYVYSVVVNQQKSLGFEWEHVYYVQVGVLPDESVERDTTSRSEDEVTAEYLEFYNRLQRHPAVESACYTLMHFHYVWKNGSGTMSRDTLKTNSFYREVTPSYFTVFRVKGADGCSPEELTRRASHANDFVMTENAAHRLLTPDDDNTIIKGTELAGLFIHSGVSMRDGEPDSVHVAAVCENQKYNEYGSWQRATYRIVQLGQGDFKTGYRSIPYHDMFIRIKADADRPGFVESFRKEMKKQLRVGNLYLADMRPMSYYRNDHLADYRSDLYTYLAIAGFFLANAFLAILGTFWFRTQQRREELAVRLVTGATPRSLLALLMGEGFLLITFAYVPALVVAYNLGISDLVETWPVEWSAARFLTGGIITYLLLLVIAAVSIWFPARQAMKIHPAEALHGE
jgi:putative ABC transport system permease protein